MCMLWRRRCLGCIIIASMHPILLRFMGSGAGSQRVKAWTVQYARTKYIDRNNCIAAFIPAKRLELLRLRYLVILSLNQPVFKLDTHASPQRSHHVPAYIDPPLSSPVHQISTGADFDKQS